MKNSVNILSLKAAILLITIFLFAVIAKGQDRNFSGLWARNMKQCDPGDLSMNSIPVTLSVKQSTAMLELTRTSKTKAVETLVYSEKLAFDGSASAVKIINNLNKKATLQWAKDHHSFMISADYTDDEGNPVQKIKETWTLSGDGKQLIIDRVDASDGREYRLKEVFDRQ